MENLSKKFRSIADELNLMYKNDQLLRNHHLSDPTHQTWNDSIDHRNTEQIKKIIKNIGWPTISKVGIACSLHAWILVQHADHDPKFQKMCLELMKAEPKNEVDRANIAFLEDRVAVGDGKPQPYGTQFYRNSDGQMLPHPIFDLKNIEQRRKEMGLETFKEYQLSMSGRNSA